MGLQVLSNPEGLEPEDEDAAVISEKNPPPPTNQSTNNSQATELRMPMSKKANNEAELACEKWVNKAVRDVSQVRLLEYIFIYGFF